MLRKKRFVIVCFIVLVTMYSVNIFGQETEVALEDKKITIQMSKKPLYTIFYRLIQKYDVAIGLEESELDKEHWYYEFEENIALDIVKASSSSDKVFPAPFPVADKYLLSVNFVDARLEDVMDSIVKQMKYYKWEINDGVINIFPSQGRDPRLKKHMNTNVKSFAVKKGEATWQIWTQIMLKLPEFRSFLKENKIELDPVKDGATSFKQRLLSESISLKDMTFKELLNAITKSKRGGWLLRIKNYKSIQDKEFVHILI